MHPTDPEEGYFADGMVDDIIHALACLKELFVVARGSVLGYGGATIDVRAIGKELGVRYVLYGSVRRSGGRLHIETQLSDAETGTIIRSDQYEGGLTDVFELQGRITVNVVRDGGAARPRARADAQRGGHRREPDGLRLPAAGARPPLSPGLRVVLAWRGACCSMPSPSDPRYALAYAYIAQWYSFRVGEIGSTDPEADAAASLRTPSSRWNWTARTPGAGDLRP